MDILRNLKQVKIQFHWIFETFNLENLHSITAAGLMAIYMNRI